MTTISTGLTPGQIDELARIQAKAETGAILDSVEVRLMAANVNRLEALIEGTYAALDSHVEQEGEEVDVRLPNGIWADVRDVLNGAVEL